MESPRYAGQIPCPVIDNTYHTYLFEILSMHP